MIRSRILAATALKHSSLAPLTTVRHASLSAIHRGLHQSDRVQGTTSKRKVAARRPPEARSRRGSDARAVAAGPPSGLDAVLRAGRRDSRSPNARTTKALAGAKSDRQRAKLRKKLAKEADEEENGKETRRKRFINPEAEHGKRSLVYHLKYGNLKEMADKVKLDEPVRPLPFRRSREGSGNGSSARSSGSFSEATRRDSDRTQRNDVGRPRRELREFDQQDRRDRTRRNDREGAENREDRPRRQHGDSGRQEGFERPRRNDWDPNVSDVEKARKGGLMPMTVKYTTAASQFLYGRSVVKAALGQARRKLYNLYIYGNEARIDKKDDDAIRDLARYHKVPIQVVPEGEQRLMDKMSSGRPHNGYVLEASPLPQPPIKSLGALEEVPGKLGFHVTLGHQSREEVAVNGEETFIPRANNATPRPFVLLLNEILDPGNLGGLIRTASYLGVDAVGITSRSSSTLTPVVLKSAAGAVEEVTIFTVDDTVEFIESSKKAGWKTYAAVAPPVKKLMNIHAGKFLSTEDLEQEDPLRHDPCILVLGNEGHGLSKQVKVAADYELSVPRFVQGFSSVDSLNVSVAAGLLCHSFVKGSAKKGRRSGVTGAVDIESTDAVSTKMRENAASIF